MILAGDIGGTKVNLAWFAIDRDRLVRGPEQTYRSRDYSSLADIARNFLTRHDLTARFGAFGVAGPVRNGRAQLTNLSWIVDVEELRSQLDLQRVFLLNDLQANAYGIATLSAEDFVELNQGGVVDHGNFAIIAAGTGLGQAALLWTGSEYVAIASEGGHGDFAPRTPLQTELLVYLRERFTQPSWEHVLSGPGFLHIYQFLRDTKRGEEPPWLRESFESADPAAVITRAGLDQTCPLCIQTLDLFVECYGAEAANLGLKLFATGGVFIGGGIAPKIIDKLRDGSFMRSFIGQGRMKDLLASMPVRVILNDKAALMGAASHAANRSGLLR